MASLLIWLIFVNLGAFMAFGLDKSRAMLGQRRIAESTLLLTAIVGGTGGAYAGRHWFRHKTRKQPFSNLLHVIAVVQGGMAAGLLL